MQANYEHKRGLTDVYVSLVPLMGGKCTEETGHNVLQNEATQEFQLAFNKAKGNLFFM